MDSAFIKANTKIHLIRIEAPASVSGPAAPNSLVRIKLEIDTDPPAGIATEAKTLLEPFPFSVRLVSPPGLLAGKLHACLCRSWKPRVKGRDWYDFLFFVTRGVRVDREQLKARMIQSGHWEEGRGRGAGELRRLLHERISSIDWKQAAEDVRPFVRDPRSLELWSQELFDDAAERLFAEDQG